MVIQVLVCLGVYIVGYCITFAMFGAYERRSSARGGYTPDSGAAYLPAILWPLSLAIVLVILAVSMFGWSGKQVWHGIKRYLVSPVLKRRLQQQTQNEELSDQQRRFEKEGVPPMGWKD